MQAIKTVLALDVGTSRTGVALARMVVGIASPYTTIEAEPTGLASLVQSLIDKEQADAVVVGVPRGLSGQDTEQTKLVTAVIAELSQKLKVPVYEQDEALTSKVAEDELKQRGKPYSRGDIDSLAATIILQDFIDAHPEMTT